MPGVPDFVISWGWWALFAFLMGVVFFRAQGTYWLGRLMRARATLLAAQPDRYPRMARLSTRLTGPRLDRARAFVEKWGFAGVSVSFLTIGFQTMVNAAAGYVRMPWLVYTAAMIPGCAAWAAWYGFLGLSLWEAWQRSPWLFLAALVAVVLIAWALTGLGRVMQNRIGADAARTESLRPTAPSDPRPATGRH